MTNGRLPLRAPVLLDDSQCHGRQPHATGTPAQYLGIGIESLWEPVFFGKDSWDKLPTRATAMYEPRSSAHTRLFLVDEDANLLVEAFHMAIPAGVKTPSKKRFTS